VRLSLGDHAARDRAEVYAQGAREGVLVLPPRGGPGGCPRGPWVLGWRRAAVAAATPCYQAPEGTSMVPGPARAGSDGDLAMGHAAPGAVTGARPRP